MPISIAFAQPATVLVQGSGDVTFAEMADAIDRVAGMTQLRPGTRVLANACLVTGLPGTSEIRAIAQQLTKLSVRGVEAVAIVAQRPVIYGVARMFATFAGIAGVNVSVFRGEVEAVEWLEEQVGARRQVAMRGSASGRSGP